MYAGQTGWAISNFITRFISSTSQQALGVQNFSQLVEEEHSQNLG